MVEEVTLTILFHLGSCGLPVPHTEQIHLCMLPEAELTMAWIGSEIVRRVNFP